MKRADEFKIGDTVTHQLSKAQMIVLASSTDDMVSCRYFDNNGLVQSQWFYPHELNKFAPKEQKSGFTK